ncbi:MAG: hypothetical protein GX824_00195 [Clostridiales bacterium]|jgi:hypothetical protein|nr:hypothetical protein [Clostridiales bacterium]
MKMKSELSKLIRAYIITIIVCICVSGVICGAIIAGNNTKALSEGERAATAGIQTDEKVTLTVAEKEISLDFLPIEKLDYIALATPAPLSSVIFLLHSAYLLAVELF